MRFIRDRQATTTYVFGSMMDRLPQLELVAPLAETRERAPESPEEEVTLLVGLDDTPPDLDDALGDDANATSDIDYSMCADVRYSPTSPDAHDDEGDGARAAEVVDVEMPT
ncbi:hypothetical protein CYMTET_37483 [Cymbomonas tetramitiformis]|uniref:Uncharacterized protein n=1 Tax=Cymbomonas tetramitiformis TaxID=36881 RepID=A0AAE0CG78_9CHLO|nr:hypothetical protein CYMTET_37483 [Cymbomonas tetramitiformis]